MGGPVWKGALDKGAIEHLARNFREAGGTFVSASWTAAQAYLAWGLLKAFPKTWVWVVDGPKTLDELSQDMETLAFGQESYLTCYPAWETMPGETIPLDPEILGERMRCLQKYLDPPATGIVLTSIQALTQKTLSPPTLARNIRTLELAHEHDPEALAAQLLESGYSFVHEVQGKCEATLRGGLLDVWPPTEDWPLRIEFFGDVVDSIRTFDPVEQTSLVKLPSVTIAPALEWEHLQVPAQRASFMDYLPRDAAWVWCDEGALEQHAEMYLSTVAETEATALMMTYNDVRSHVADHFDTENVYVGTSYAGDLPETHVALETGESLPALTGTALHPDVMEETRHKLVGDLLRKARNGQQVHLFFDTPGATERFLQMYPKETGEGSLQIHVGRLSEGFVYQSEKLLVVSESDVFGYKKLRRPRLEAVAQRKIVTSPLASWTDIQPGDLVVHADHGIGKYLGLYEIDFDQQEQEVLAVEYADRARLYVPVSHIHLLSRYVGVGRRRPNLHKLGGGRWIRQKIAAEKAVQDLAALLLETQASREALNGHAFPHDSAWQHEFETSFPFQETDDQARAIDEVKRDMESQRPMDRLVCGDVGYGKTEVAMRATFKAVMGGKQVAILVPTSILAQQQYYTFCNRMAAYPITIEMLSRFRTRGEQQKVVQQVAEGQVDIIIGTHRLVQPDVSFKDLGLVIIDEEQRFGVMHKERLKQLRKLVDILTLTATPIPRTLYMSLTGAKDMSTIQTPPQERLPIRTIVSQYDDDTVRQAILRELSREGQIYYLHNRVKTIHKVEEKLKALVPEARIGVAHGQMSERSLASIMQKFIENELDVLLCTTIIESGVDIPNVNTILIDRADRFGMADLYQLRGRVGRYKHKAYAYLLLPRHGRLFDSARKRIGAIQRHSSLGAGFKLALRDLEIRGAGNILGAQQSGHIAAIGFDLYCQLLQRTIAMKKGEPVPPMIDAELKLDFLDLSPRHEDDKETAAVPYTYIEDENHRIDVYRKISAASSEEEILKMHEELRDRFGPIPHPVDRLLRVARLRIVSSLRGIRHVETRGDKLMLMRDGDYLMRNRRFPRLNAKDASDRLDEILHEIKAWS